MSEREQEQPRSPLESERGTTSVNSSVVSKIAGLAVGGIEGIYMGGGASRAVGGFFGGSSGSGDMTRGISVNVGKIEAAIDVTMEIEYGGNIPQLTERVRSRITERVESLTGLRIAELNVTVSDVVFPEGTEGRGREARRGPLSEDQPPTGAGRSGDPDDTAPVNVGAARSEAITRSGSRFSEETAGGARDQEEDETAELESGEDPEQRTRRRDRRRRRGR